uniref:Uncharacterized protein n=1 Tax=Arundo donax TaxID=35708 RepID=A0A0A9HGR5_ARUDO
METLLLISQEQKLYACIVRL